MDPVLFLPIGNQFTLGMLKTMDLYLWQYVLKSRLLLVSALFPDLLLMYHSAAI